MLPHPCCVDSVYSAEMIPATTFAGRRVAVFGLGRSGMATYQSLLAGGAIVMAWDENERARSEAIATGAELVDLEGIDWSTIDSLVLAPGVPLTHPTPHWIVDRARGADVEIIGDIEIFARERASPKIRCPFHCHYGDKRQVYNDRVDCAYFDSCRS